MSLIEMTLQFSDESATVKLGLGKNMVQSMRYWMQAYGIIDSERNK